MVKKHLSLFSGIGGLDLAGEWAGFETVGQCEWAKFPTTILEKHWPHVPRWKDIRELTGESFHEKTGCTTIDLITGGFPCQPFSHAGKRRGLCDDRYLWPEMLRVIDELRPTWVVGENVAGIISLALDQVLADLENKGYETRAFVLPACSVGAPHRRDRVAIVAWDTNCNIQGTKRQVPPRQQDTQSSRVCKNVSHTYCKGLQGLWCEPESVSKQTPGFSIGSSCKERITGQWKLEPGVGRVADGVPHRVDRLKSLGNAVVPQQFYPILKAISVIIDATENQ